MISKSNKARMANIAFIVGVILVFDVLTIISNAFIAPYLDGYGMPDILIYVKTGVFLLILVLLLVWLYNKGFNITVENLKIILYIGLVIILFYFFSLFMYKYLLLLDTSDIIKNKILNGNPALIYDFSTQNYKTLDYITGIFSGFNSEIILFTEGLFLLAACLKIDNLTIEEEPEIQYDDFLFDKLLFPLFSFLAITSFLSIDIIEFKYDLYGAYEIALSLVAFIITVPGLVTAIRVYKHRGKVCTKSQFVGWNKLIFIISALSMLFFTLLSVLDLINFLIDEGSYRIFTALLSLIISTVIFFRAKRVISLENK